MKRPFTQAIALLAIVALPVWAQEPSAAPGPSSQPAAGPISPAPATQSEQPSRPNADGQSAPQETESEADDEPATVWLLEDREWDFDAVATVYQPVRGVYLTETRSSVWMLELVRELFPGEAGLHAAIQDTPFRLVLLDEDRTVVDVRLPLKLTPVTGKLGDRVLLSVLMPDDDSLAKVTSVRVERRTEVGFPAMDVQVDPTALRQPVIVEEP
jgi:hypothetical protein